MTQYDLAGNPLPDDNDANTPTNHAPISPVWPPPVQNTAYPGYGMEDTNTSGTQTTVPPEILTFRWNWGAFFLNWIWCFNHRLTGWGVGILLLNLTGWIPGVNYVTGTAHFGLSIYLGLMGHQLAWKNRRFDGGIPQFIEVQSAWMKWGIGLAIIPVTIALLAAILFPIFAKARERARATSYSSPMIISAPQWNSHEIILR